MSLATIDGVADFVDEYAHDSAGRLTALTYSQGETVLASYAWTYGDDGSSLLSVETTSPHAPLSPFSWIPSGGLMPGQDTGAIVNALWEGTGTPASLITEITVLDGTVSYQYDSAGQLLAATYTAGQAAESYSYDANGNRVTADGAAYLTGPNNQLLFDGVFSYSYDPEGNRTARFIDVNANGLLDAGDTAATTYAWDHRNRLTRVTDYDLYGDPATRAVDYLYDTENRWIGRDVDLDGDGQIDTRTRFAYDGNQIVMQFDRALAPNDDPADPLTLENLSHRYLWNPAAVDQLMADEHVTAAPSSPSSILWPLADHLGTIRDLAAYDSSTGTTTIVNHRTFDAYGNLQSQTTTAVDCLFAFTGRPLDQATDLQNNLHRWYDPAGCRWMTEDPIGFEGKDGNLNAYVGNGPVNATDPTGLAIPISDHCVFEVLCGSTSSKTVGGWLVNKVGQLSWGHPNDLAWYERELRRWSGPRGGCRGFAVGWSQVTSDSAHSENMLFGDPAQPDGVCNTPIDTKECAGQISLYITDLELGKTDDVTVEWTVKATTVVFWGHSLFYADGFEPLARQTITTFGNAPDTVFLSNMYQPTYAYELLGRNIVAHQSGTTTVRVTVDREKQLVLLYVPTLAMPGGSRLKMMASGDFKVTKIGLL